MKTITPYTLLLLILFCISASAQSDIKKPESKSVGIRYGLFLVNGISNQVAVSGWLKKDFEVGTGFAVGYSQSNNSDEFQGVVTDVNGATQPSNILQKSVSKNIHFQFAPFMCKHFFLTKSIDLYTGFSIPFEIRKPFVNGTTTISSQDYLTQQTSVTQSPVSIGLGAGITLGCNYFINRHFAIGAVTSIAGTYQFSRGKTTTKVKYTYSGDMHPLKGQTGEFDAMPSMESARGWFTLNAAQSFGIVMSYYFGKKSATPKAEVITK